MIRTRPSARDLIRLVLGDTFESWDSPIDLTGLEPGYAAQLVAAQERSGVDEAVVTGAGTIEGTGVAVIAGEFAFLAGSIGRATAGRIVTAVRRATRERLPLLVATCSGGTRMQEGTPAFVEMISISKAIVAHKAAGLPYLVYLRNPTTGGVFASWGSLGHVTVAEPGALIGFLGPRIAEALTGKPFPSGVQVAENLVAKGVIDGVVAPEELASVARRVLRLLTPSVVGDVPLPTPGLGAPPPRRTSTWESVLLTRRPDRPGVRDLLRLGADDVIPLSGTGDGQRDAGLLLALTAFGGLPCVLVGQDRRHQTPDRPLGPTALREARRGMRLAEELRLPLVAVIDTPGAALSPRAEEGALAGEIARCLADMSSLSVPSVSVLLGQGSGGAALALLPADRVIAAEHAWLSPLPPEGASAIVHHDTAHAPLMAERQRVSAFDLLDEGIVHVVVPERPAAHDDPQAFAHAMIAACVAAIRDATRIRADGRKRREP
ncbi:acetyl-CoA carboxylase carboxyl transferase subunit beta [Pseudonocardia hierapolitana]|uniref:Acetyl-CoA carboxylase carboxyl transferase subunit beta n=1 Tax=Pseudonocardia hierapolitana TaxID=1128676 RepID=A0A561T0C9_9PSEU|nr:carboxyl transferase domain-containing protein [Pseudonocardia hierapolitana]TWF80578.1 acetyl-CoA carboxylase carboxyl transferase subunit beta [Pseudonocardia hierapolitana]